MTTPNIDLLTFTLCMIALPFLWGYLNLLADSAPLWKNSIVVGMALIGAGGIAIFIPELKSYAAAIRAVGWTGMVIGTFFSFYVSSPEAQNEPMRRSTARAIGMGLGFILGAIVLLFTIQRGQDLSEVQVLTMKETNSRLDRVEARQRRLIIKLEHLINLSTIDSLNTSQILATQQQSLSNQQRVLKSQSDVHKSVNRVGNMVDTRRSKPAPVIVPDTPKGTPAKKRLKFWPFSKGNGQDAPTGNPADEASIHVNN